MKIATTTLTILLILSISSVVAQNLSKDTFGKGISVLAQDSSFYIKFGFRFQTLYIGEKNLKSRLYQDRMMTRRVRIKLDGFAFNPSLKFKVQLALANQDQKGGHLLESGNTANIVLDALMQWHFTENWSLWFGQAKLPSTQEMAISSQKLQFVDRSLVHTHFSLDRDRGIQLHHRNGTSSSFVFKQALALSLGEGRNVVIKNPVNGYQISGRLEFFPLGAFTRGGDYFMSDSKREISPKIFIGIAGSMNLNAVRQRGTLGAFVTDSNGDYVTNDLKSFFVDLMFKHNGWSALSAYASRSTEKTNNGFMTGDGLFAQIGYLLPSNWEFAARFSEVSGDTHSSLNQVLEFTLGISRYIVEHNLKVQSDISYQNIPSSNNELIWRFQTELTF